MEADDELVTAEQMRRSFINANFPGKSLAGTFDWCQGRVKLRCQELIEMAIELTRE